MKNNALSTSHPPSKAGRLQSSPRPRRTAATLISAELADRLKAVSALVGVPGPDLLRIGLRRLLAGIERDGFLRTGPKAEEDEAGGAVLKIPPALRSQIRDLAAEHGQSAGEMAAMLLACGIGKLRGGQASVAVPGLQDG